MKKWYMPDFLREKSNRRAVLLVLASADVLLIVSLVYLSLAYAKLGRVAGALPSPAVVADTSGTKPAPTEEIPPTETAPPAPTATLVPIVPTATEPAPTPTPMPMPTAAPTELPVYEGPIVYGESVEGRPLRAYRFGNGDSARAIIGGIHGGYEWNTVELVSKTLTLLQDHPEEVPSDVTLYVIPCANPDGYVKSFDLSGRFNANEVDLNRNWDYNHQMTATHGTRPVKAGHKPFSEPETATLRDLILGNDIELVIFYHSAMSKIFSGEERAKSYTDELAVMMSEVTGYPYDPAGVPGQITTGDAVDWLSDEGLAGIEIELSTHQDIEWERNLRGIRAFLDWEIPVGTALPTPIPGESTTDLITYIVQPGETLSAIALTYGVRLEDLMYINNITDPDSIQQGKALSIPVIGDGPDADQP